MAWRGARLTESNLLQLPYGKIALDKYVLNKVTLSKKERTTPAFLPKTCGWRPKHITFTTTQINPNLNAVPSGIYEITHHPTSQTEALICAPVDRLITKLTKARLQKLKNMYTPTNNDGTFPQAVAELILHHKAVAYDITLTKAHNVYKKNKQRNQTEPNGACSIPDALYDTLHDCFNNKIRYPLQTRAYKGYQLVVRCIDLTLNPKCGGVGIDSSNTSNQARGSCGF